MRARCRCISVLAKVEYLTFAVSEVEQKLGAEKIEFSKVHIVLLINIMFIKYTMQFYCFAFCN